tara:strand:+ start:39 stop:527 length:489 start_codon:yes stop_codon:yes gene_type:complete
MAKRMTDSEKWKDPWFSELSNDYKIVWLYLLDDCDNAGIWQCNMRMLNFNCNTTFNKSDIEEEFKERLSMISKDKFIINKFCEFQYGVGFLNSKNKAVISAVNKLNIYNLVEYSKGIYTLSIPYQYSIDTPKEQEQDKFKDKLKEEKQERVKEFEKEFSEFN